MLICVQIITKRGKTTATEHLVFAHGKFFIAKSCIKAFKLPGGTLTFQRLSDISRTLNLKKGADWVSCY